MIFKIPLYFALATTTFLLCGCASVQVVGDVQSGRYLLLNKKPQQALGRFQRAADHDPHYVTDFTAFEQGVWTYVGRAHYQLGDLDKARAALDRAKETHGDDAFAHVYLGLVMMRQGELADGLSEAKTGLRSLRTWLRDLDRRERSGLYWDPGSVLAGEIDNLLSMMNGGEARWQEVASGLEWLGREFEEEPDRAIEDEKNDTDGDMTS